MQHAKSKAIVSSTAAAAQLSSSNFANGAANRSPFRPRRVLQPTAARASSSSSALFMCFDRSGTPSGVPAWFPQLYQAANEAGVYEALTNITKQDPWQIVIGWVPSRFMGPQKPGRKANGDILHPPTKGRNASVYHDMYNASWTTSFEAAGYEYHYQLVHRNAMAVCIRERLHILQWLCGPAEVKKAGEAASFVSGLEPLSVYHCPCRHCREGFSPMSVKSQKAPLGRLLPHFFSSSPVLKDGVEGEMKIRTSGHMYIEGRVPPVKEGCIEDLSAPWTVPISVVPKFPYEGLHRSLDALLVTQSDPNRIVIVTIFNAFWIDHLHNFVFSMVSKARVVNYIVATMDDEALSLCIANRLPCLDATEFAEFEPDMVQGGAGYQQGSTRKVSEAMSWIKPRLAVAILKRGYGFLMSDLDLTWGKNLWKELLDVRVDVAHQCDSNNKFSINSGFYLARSNARTMRFFENIMTFTPEENSDQTAMKLFAKYDHTHGASNTCLSKWSFNMKCNYKVPGSVRRDAAGVETFEWAPYDRTQAATWTILHATCLSGAQNKLLYLRTIGAWSVDDLDRLTSTSSTCLATRDSAAKPSTTVEYFASVPIRLDSPPSEPLRKTQHSAKYTAETSTLFLQKRH